MNADGYMTHPARLIKHMIHHSQETPLYAQIYGGNEDTLIKTAQDIERKYPSFAGIELNIWCPSPKVMACGGWSGMMRDKKQCLKIIKNISQNISMPFSIKVRTWLNDADKQEQFAMLLDAAPYCHTITVHGRTFNQWHTNIVDREFIYRLKKEVGATCKIIGNGWITSYQDAIDKKHNLDGIMTAQAAIGNPRAFVNHIPTLKERYAIIIEHLKLSLAYEIRRKQILGQHPNNPNDKILTQNRQVLHYKKKIDDDDTLVHTIGQTQLHDYSIPFPTIEELQTISNSIKEDDKQPYRSIIEFRKYLFNYIKGIPWSKECKQEIAKTQSYTDIHTLMTTFFQNAQNTPI